MRARSSSGSRSSRGATGESACTATGYGGYVAWAAAKRMPAALKAIATADASAPGVDVPMAGSIFRNSAYRWVYELGEHAGREKAANDDARWRALDEDWYKHGRRYREYPSLPGRASALFRSWLNHPSYDRYWQKLVPFRQSSRKIDIPVLTMTRLLRRWRDGRAVLLHRASSARSAREPCAAYRAVR